MNEYPMVHNFIRIICTGNGTHKPAQLTAVRKLTNYSGETEWSMGEGGSSLNYQNSRGFAEGQKMEAALYPLTPDEDGPVEGVSTKSYRFVCDRCARDIRIDGRKFWDAVELIGQADLTAFDLSRLPFA